MYEDRIVCLFEYNSQANVTLHYIQLAGYQLKENRQCVLVV